MFDILTRLQFLTEASTGNTKAHAFLHECGVRPLRTDNIGRFLIGEQVRTFIPRNSEICRVIMFSDNSGVDLCREDPKSSELNPIFMSSDITSWVKNYVEIDSLSFN
jgi:hypothetical protein